MSTVTLIQTALIICIIVLLVLVGVVFLIYWQNKKKENGEANKDASNQPKTETKLQGIESMSKFLAFDEIVDSMIVRKNRQQYVMVIQCKGVNYDLLGQEEKIAIENGFTQFLNTLRFPVQLYIQTRSLNLKDSIEQYSERVEEVKQEVLKLDNQIKKEKANGRLDVVRKLEFDRRRKMNILEYGADITNYVTRMSQNRDVLQQNAYVVVSYYTSEFGGEIANYSKEEIDNIAFSELYTKAQTLIRGLAASGVTGRVINSEELIELLYIAYNRDDSELISVKRAVDAQYDSLYNTAKDVFEKQKELIEEKVEKEAIDLAANSITKADQILKLKKESKAEIRRRAISYVEEYKNEMTNELYSETINQIEKANVSEVNAGEKLNKRTNSDMENEAETRVEHTRRPARRTATATGTRPTASTNSARPAGTTRPAGATRPVNAEGATRPAGATRPVRRVVKKVEE